jgi:hypothetical protein
MIRGSDARRGSSAWAVATEEAAEQTTAAPTKKVFPTLPIP